MAELSEQDKIISFDALSAYRAEAAKAGKVVVAMNGTFDLVHKGHTRALQRASKLIPVARLVQGRPDPEVELVVGAWPDLPVREWKGRDRPYQTVSDRMEILAAMGCVSRVFEIPMHLPVELFSRYAGATAVLEKLRPDIFVLGQTQAMVPGPYSVLDGTHVVDVQTDPTLANKVDSTTGLGQRMNGHRDTVMPYGLPLGVALPRPAFPGDRLLVD